MIRIKTKHFAFVQKNLNPYKQSFDVSSQRRALKKRNEYIQNVKYINNKYLQSIKQLNETIRKLKEGQIKSND